MKIVETTKESEDIINNCQELKIGDIISTCSYHTLYSHHGTSYYGRYLNTRPEMEMNYFRKNCGKEFVITELNGDYGSVKVKLNSKRSKKENWIDDDAIAPTKNTLKDVSLNNGEKYLCRDIYKNNIFVISKESITDTSKKIVQHWVTGMGFTHHCPVERIEVLGLLSKSYIENFKKPKTKFLYSTTSSYGKFYEAKEEIVINETNDAFEFDWGKIDKSSMEYRQGGIWVTKYFYSKEDLYLFLKTARKSNNFKDKTK